jgi:ATP-binding protein involved in chromosome partitioning
VKRIRTYFDLPDATRSDVSGQMAHQSERLRRRLARVKRTVAVASGKGGVGKSVVTANLAAALAADGLRVGVLDADLNGPSQAKLLGVRGGRLRVRADGVEPVAGPAGIRVISMDLLLADADAPVRWSGPESESFVWRGTLEANALREFFADTEWGDLDYLLVDLAPGTERLEPLRALLPSLDGLVLVTLGAELAGFVVGKSVRRARELSLPIVGYVENMAGYVCPDCGSVGPLFGQGHGFEDVRCLARIPFDPELSRLADAGRPFVLERPDSVAGRAIHEAARELRGHFGAGSDGEGAG